MVGSFARLGTPFSHFLINNLPLPLHCYRLCVFASMCVCLCHVWTAGGGCCKIFPISFYVATSFYVIQTQLVGQAVGAAATRGRQSEQQQHAATCSSFSISSSSNWGERSKGLWAYVWASHACCQHWPIEILRFGFTCTNVAPTFIHLPHFLAVLSASALVFRRSGYLISPRAYFRSIFY